MTKCDGSDLHRGPTEGWQHCPRNACASAGWIRDSMDMLFKMLWKKRLLLAFTAKPESDDSKEEK